MVALGDGIVFFSSLLDRRCFPRLSSLTMAVKQPLGVHDTNLPTDVESLVSQLRADFAQKLDALDAERRRVKQQQFQIASNIAKLTKAVQTMKLSEFNALYKCDLVSLFQNEFTEVVPSTPSRSGTSSGTLVATIQKKQRTAALELHVDGNLIRMDDKASLQQLNPEAMDDFLAQVMALRDQCTGVLQELTKD